MWERVLVGVVDGLGLFAGGVEGSQVSQWSRTQSGEVQKVQLTRGKHTGAQTQENLDTRNPLENKRTQ